MFSESQELSPLLDQNPRAGLSHPPGQLIVPTIEFAVTAQVGPTRVLTPQREHVLMGLAGLATWAPARRILAVPQVAVHVRADASHAVTATDFRQRATA